ncbi:MAG: AAA family ATPase [Candidatus Melainabacteria bacterium]|nr:AAA family ATPase [Candidatus Melainabacteria bacterium]
MALTDFAICNYRSIKNVWLKLQRVNVFVGPNGCGKSNLYRALYLMSSAANGQFARSIAEEGGMPSAMWCGGRGKRDSSHMNLSVKFDDLQYDLICGVVDRGQRIQVPPSIFSGDLDIKEERLLRLKGGGSTANLLSRKRASVIVRDTRGQSVDYTMRLAENESVLTGVRDPHKYPDLSTLRMELLNWRFYHHFRTDKDSPLRKPQLAVATDIMAHDGSDFVSALGTIIEMGDAEGLLAALDDAFPGSVLTIDHSSRGLRLRLQTPGFNRAFDTSELSDGTLQYLCLLAAIYSSQPPSVLAINEPETSIHPDLYEPLAKMLAYASQNSQVWITTHSKDLADYMVEYTGYSPQELEKVEGETRLVGVGLGGYRYEEGDNDGGIKPEILDDNEDDEFEDDNEND